MKSYFESVISGKKRGLFSLFFRLFLFFCSIFYGFAIQIRLCFYQFKIFPTYTVPIPIISVGNITTGGSGKTPFVELLTKMIEKKSLSPTLISRGYHPLPGQKFNDEALLLQENLPNVPHLLGSNRVELARKALSKHQASCVILDDGFQHIRLHRDLNILLVDTLCPFGYEKLLPAGLLREPIKEIRRAHCIGLTRCNQQTEEILQKIEKTLQKIAPLPIFRVGLEVFGWEDITTKKKLSLLELQKKQGYGFCGIGNPNSFQKTLLNNQISLVNFQIFPDHHHYQSSDLDELIQKAKKQKAEFLITTQKDGVKIKVLTPNFPVIVLKIKCTLLTNEDILEKLLKKTLDFS